MLSTIISLYRKSEALYCVSFLLTLSLISFSWFKDGSLFSGTDSYFPLERMEAMRATLFAWDDRSFGSMTASIAFLLPYGVFLIFSEYFSITASLTQSSWFYYIFAGSGVSMFFLTVVITKWIQKKPNYLMALIAGLFFMFNPYVGAMATSYTYLWVTYSFLPLKLGLYIKGLVEKKNFNYMIFFVFIWILTSASQYTNPKYLILDLLPLFLFFLCYLLFIAKDKKEKRRAVFFSFTFFVLLILLCAYWFLPALVFIREAFIDSQKAYSTINLSRHTGFYLNSGTDLIRTMKLLGLWALEAGFKDTPYFNWIAMYKTPLLIFLGGIIPLIIFSTSTFVLRMKKREYYPFVILYLMSLFGMMGLEKSFEKVNSLLIKKIPLYLDLFSYPYQIFGIYFVISCAVLFSLGIWGIYNYYKFTGIKKVVFFGTVFVLFIGIYGRPVWTGEIMSPRSEDTFQYLPSYLYQVPNYYYTASEFMKKKRLDARVFSLPYSKTGGAVYLWSRGYSGIDISSRLLGNIIYDINPLTDLINDMVVSGSTENIGILLSQLNTHYILFHHDMHPSLFDRTTIYSESTEQNIKDDIDVSSSLRQFEKLDIYTLSASIFLPHFYIPSHLLFQGDIGDVKYSIGSAIFSRVENEEKGNILDELKSDNINKPKLEFRKVNSTKYRIRVHGTQGIFPIVFSESFHEGWRTYLVDSKFKNQNAKSQFKNQNLDSYKILDGNGEDQASREELKEFIVKGIVTDLGDRKEKKIKHTKWESEKQKEVPDYVEKYTIDFISKNFQGTIQNDNLPRGAFYETWFKKPLGEENHLMVNGYANSWVIDTDEMCNNNTQCIKNADGTYDMELVVEFWPQRLFYLGAFISGLTLVGCLVYVGVATARERRKKKSIVV